MKKSVFGSHAHMELKLGACEVKHSETEKFSFEKQKTFVYHMKCYFYELCENILLQVRFK